MNVIERQIWLRIQVAMAAYSYEIDNNPIMPDWTFDKLAREIDVNVDTSYEGRDNSEIDKWFKYNFDPSTGMWIHKHPDLEGIRGCLAFYRGQDVNRFMQQIRKSLQRMV